MNSTQDKIKIAQVITGLGIGGAEQHLLSLAKHLDRKQFELDFYCIIEGGELIKDFQKLGYYPKIFHGAYNYKRRFPYDIKQILRLSRTFKQKKYDIVHTHLYAADVIGITAAILAGIPRIVKSVHNIGNWKTKKKILHDRILSKFIDRVVCCSESVREFTLRQERLKRDKTITIYQGIDMAKFNVKINRTEYIKKIGLNPNFKTVGTVARLVPIKGHVYLLEAIPLILKSCPDTQFLLIGDGPLKEKLYSSIKDKPYKEKIHFLGSRSDIPELLSLLDVFVLPSLSEGLGIVILEAMAAQLPVVASRIDTIAEAVIDKQTGFLVETANAEQLAAMIIQLLMNDELRKKMGENGKERVKTHFSMSEMIQQIQKLYKHLQSDGTKKT